MCISCGGLTPVHHAPKETVCQLQEYKAVCTAVMLHATQLRDTSHMVTVACSACALTEITIHDYTVQCGHSIIVGACIAQWSLAHAQTHVYASSDCLAKQMIKQHEILKVEIEVRTLESSASAPGCTSLTVLTGASPCL